MIARLQWAAVCGLVVCCGCTINTSRGTTGASVIQVDASSTSAASVDSGADGGDSLGDGDLPLDGTPDNPSGRTSDGSADAGAEITEELCTQKCEVVAQIDCPDRPRLDDCVRDCLAMANICASTSRAYYECIVANGSAGLACDDVVERTVSLPEVCPQVQANFLACELGTPQVPPPASGPSMFTSAKAWLRLVRPLPAGIRSALR
jgi:hypothetical protein